MNPTLIYQTSASLPPNAPSYVTRQADEQIYQKLKAGEYCHVFNSRQMGKSSLRVQVTSRLEQEGVAVALIDPQGIGVHVSQGEWYAGVIENLVQDFKLEPPFDFSQWWHSYDDPSIPWAQRFGYFIERVLLAWITQPIVIFVEEIDRLQSLKFADDFFLQIRRLYDHRTQNPELGRLTFALVGVTTPRDLIRDRNHSGFNIGTAIEMEGFTLAEAAPLAAGLVGRVADPQTVLKAVLYWSGGQPFLTQKLLNLVVREVDSGQTPAPDPTTWVGQMVQRRVINNWEAQDVPEHLRTLQDRILQVDQQRRGQLLGLYQSTLAGEEGIAADNSYEQAQLRLTGLVVKHQGRLRVYNPVYRAVFNPAWVEHQLGELRPSFYAEALRTWHDSADSDPSYLLRGQALEDAEIWAKGKQLSGEDLRFLEVSRQHNIQEIQHNLEEIQWQLDRKAERNEILTAAREQAEKESQTASQQLRIIKEEVQRLQSSREYEKQQMQHQQEANRALAAAREQVEKDLNTINQQLLTTKAEIQRQRQEKATATKILTETQDQLRALTLERNQVEKILDTKSQELDNIKQELSQNKARFSRTLNKSRILIVFIIAFFVAGSVISYIFIRYTFLFLNKKISGREEKIENLSEDISKINNNIINLNLPPSPGYSEEQNSPMDPELLATTLYMAQYFKENPDSLENNNQKISALLKERLKSFRELRINTKQNIVRSILWIESPGEEPILASGGQDGTVKLWKHTGEPLKTPELSNQNVLFQNQEGYVQSISWNGKQLAIVHKIPQETNTLVLFNKRDGKYESVNIPIQPDSLSKFISTFSKAQWIRTDVLLTLDTQDNLRLWRLDNNSNTLTEIPQKSPIQKIKSFSWSEASQTLAIGSAEGDLNRWELSDELQFLALPKEAIDANQGGPIWSIGWRQDGKVIATGGSDGTIRLWKATDNVVQNNDKVVQNINTGQGVVWYILWKKDNETLITGGADGSIKFWDINDLSKPKKTIQTFQGSISGMSLTQDEKTLATIGTDETIKLWLLEPEKIPDDTSLEDLIKLSCKQLSSYLESRPEAKEILRDCLKSQRESQTIPMEWDNYRKIQYFGGPLAAKYTWDNPFQTTS